MASTPWARFSITPASHLFFKKWKGTRTDVVLHYFDNFPCVAVATRATRLRSYLAKRIARGEIAPCDAVSLVGHSTGGLDIRQMISELGNFDRARSLSVDGGSAVKSADLLDFIHQVVFLSVPQWGTNIADWVRAHRLWREAAIAQARAVVGGAQLPLLDHIEERIAGSAASLAGADILLAVQDALQEADDGIGERDPVRAAVAHEAASALALYLRHMASDFGGIDDLTSQRPAGGPRSPAHFNRVERAEEQGIWSRLHIRALSFATLGSRPFNFRRGQPAPPWELAKIWTFPEFDRNPEAGDSTDLTYRICYRACSGGPFRNPGAVGKVSTGTENCPRGPLESWDNDGIVNTASMFWPAGENVLVAGDHLDIVGHHRLVPAEPGNGRAWQAYDALRSSSGFSDETFRNVWAEIFEFCSQAHQRTRTNIDKLRSMRQSMRN